MNLKRLTKRVLLGLPGFEAICRRLTSNHVRVFMYHRFTPSSSASGTDEKTLERHLRLIAAHHRVISAQSHASAVLSGVEVGGCPVVVTVDDGYHDVYDIAFPLFKRWKIPATVFLTTRFVDGEMWLWWDRLLYVTMNAGVRRLVVDFGKGDRAFDLDTPGNRKEAWNAIADRCRFLPEEEKRRLLRDIEEQVGLVPSDRPLPEYRSVTWEQVRLMAQEGIEFAPHTVTHTILTRVSRNEAHWQVSESRRVLAANTGVDSRIFAYPQGGPADFSESTMEVLSKEGVDAAYLSYDPVSASRKASYQLARYGVEGSLSDFRWRLCGAEFLSRHRVGFRRRDHADVPEAYWLGSANDGEV